MSRECATYGIGDIPILMVFSLLTLLLAGEILQVFDFFNSIIGIVLRIKKKERERERERKKEKERKKKWVCCSPNDTKETTTLWVQVKK